MLKKPYIGLRTGCPNIIIRQDEIDGDIKAPDDLENKDSNLEEIKTVEDLLVKLNRVNYFSSNDGTLYRINVTSDDFTLALREVQRPKPLNKTSSIDAQHVH